MDNNNILLIFLCIILLIGLYLLYIEEQKFKNLEQESFVNSPKYKWITEGTCKSNNMEVLTLEDCKNYFKDSNYVVTGSPHGQPGCWPVLGNELTNVVKENPQFNGKGFACWTEVNDGKQCSTDVPCVCK